MIEPSSNADLRGPLHDANSVSWAVRAAAGRRLAASADAAGAAEALRRLLLDEGDTAVTQTTAEALLERRDVVGLRLVLEALNVADDDTADQLDDAITNICRQSDRGVAQLEQFCRELAAEPAESIRNEASAILLQLRRSSEGGQTGTRSS
ncbi:hypothetical protein [Streptomyces sp. NPDC015130]|uniref:hypothetical protein n=1 Tax=Streptomyces sp. NPDC015130 TaxID=3364940 RepID=UPI003701A620